MHFHARKAIWVILPAISLMLLCQKQIFVCASERGNLLSSALPETSIQKYMGDVSKYLLGLLQEKNRKNFQSYKAENSHSEKMFDLAFRTTNSPSCLELIGGAEGLCKV